MNCVNSAYSLTADENASHKSCGIGSEVCSIIREGGLCNLFSDFDLAAIHARELVDCAPLVGFNGAQVGLLAAVRAKAERTNITP
jgi:hypothetical protein